MTKKEVIYFLDQVRKILLDDKSWLESTIQPINEAFDMAISAVRAQDVPDTNVSDTISRQAAIDALKGLPTWWADDGGFYGGAQPPMTALLDPEDAVSAIANLPSVQPEIMRCGDCKHYYFADNRIPQEQWYTCELDGDRWRRPDDYCTFVVRRTDE